MPVKYDELDMFELTELAKQKGVVVDPVSDSRDEAIAKIKKASKSAKE